MQLFKIPGNFQTFQEKCLMNIYCLVLSSSLNLKQHKVKNDLLIEAIVWHLLILHTQTRIQKITACYTFFPKKCYPTLIAYKIKITMIISHENQKFMPKLTIYISSPLPNRMSDFFTLETH